MDALIAFCGIDGCGKTSLIERLKNWEPLRGCHVFRKKDERNVELLDRLYVELARDPKNYLSGSFALQRRWAYTLDFISYYEKEVAPHLNDGKPILLDRWTPCILAWTNILPREAVQPIHELIAAVPPPNLIIFISTTPEEARRRIVSRGMPKPDEDISVLRAFATSYSRELNRSPIGVRYVRNVNLDDAVEETKLIIANFLHL